MTESVNRHQKVRAESEDGLTESSSTVSIFVVSMRSDKRRGELQLNCSTLYREKQKVINPINFALLWTKRLISFQW